MTRYIYKGKEIRHTQLLNIMRSAGIGSGYRVSHYVHLRNLAENGNEKAAEILKDLEVHYDK